MTASVEACREQICNVETFVHGVVSIVDVLLVCTVWVQMKLCCNHPNYCSVFTLLLIPFNKIYEYIVFMILLPACYLLEQDML